MESTFAAAVSLKRTVVTQIFRYSEILERLNWTARWVASVKSTGRCPMFETREQMYSHVNTTLGNSLPIDYFEFGVAAGDSLKSWCAIHSHPNSRFFGFDSFFGLPADWKKGRPKGSFSTGGQPPDIDDPRVAFVPGLFQHSLPDFIAGYEPAPQVVIHNDSDLYSSTLFCLTTLNRLITKGTVVIFDEFYDALHEYRALCDYCDAFQRSYKIVAATLRYNQVAVQFS